MKRNGYRRLEKKTVNKLIFCVQELILNRLLYTYNNLQWIFCEKLFVDCVTRRLKNWIENYYL